MGIIYKATCKTTGLCYIGQTVCYKDRLVWHKRDMKYLNDKFHIALMTYGWEDFTWEIIEKCEVKMLNEREKYWIQYYDSFNNGYNSDSGGGYSDKLRNNLSRNERISYSIQKFWDEHPERKEELSKKLTGIVFTEERCRNISESLKGKPLSEEHRIRSKQGSIKYWSDQNHCKEQSERLKKYYELVGGEPEEVKTKISVSLKQYYKENGRSEEACKNISNSLKGVYVGWHWYKDKNTNKRVWWKEDPTTGEIIYKQKR